MKYKNKYELRWCDLCDTYSIWCPKCSGSSCNCMCCEECKEDQEEFNSGKFHVRHYLSKEESLTYDKIKRLRKFLTFSFKNNQKEINWEYIYNEGQFCEKDLNIFPELKEIHERLKKW